MYTYAADVWYHNWSDEGGDRYVGRVSTTFRLSLAATKIVKVAKHKWQVKIVGQPYVVSSPLVRLQQKKGSWRTVARGYGNSAGKLKLKSRTKGTYRLVYAGDPDRGLSGSTSARFKRP